MSSKTRFQVLHVIKRLETFECREGLGVNQVGGELGEELGEGLIVCKSL